MFLITGFGMNDYSLMLEAFGISERRAEEVSKLVDKYYTNHDSRIIICKSLKLESLTEAEQLLAFYIWGCLEGYSDGKNGR